MGISLGPTLGPAAGPAPDHDGRMAVAWCESGHARHAARLVGVVQAQAGGDGVDRAQDIGRRGPTHRKPSRPTVNLPASQLEDGHGPPRWVAFRNSGPTRIAKGCLRDKLDQSIQPAVQSR